MKRTVRRVLSIITVIAVVPLAACSQSGGLNKQTVGGLVGGLGGGILGSQVGSGSGKLWATGTGAVLGALVGSEVGQYMDRQDRARMSRTTYETLEHRKTGHPGTWRNPDTGNRGRVVVRDTYQTSRGRYCREFQQYVTVGGRREVAYGTACRMPDGSWRIQQ